MFTGATHGEYIASQPCCVHSFQHFHGSARSQTAAQGKPRGFWSNVSPVHLSEGGRSVEGLSNWEELRKVAARFGVDRTLPFWHVHTRNDWYETMVEALFSVDLDTSETGRLYFSGVPSRWHQLH